MSECVMSSANYHCDFSDISDDVSATQFIDSVRFLVSNYNRYVGRVNEAAYSSGYVLACTVVSLRLLQNIWKTRCQRTLISGV